MASADSPGAARRGPGISAEEDLELARSWRRVSESVTDMRSETFWLQMEDIFAAQPEVPTRRSSKSLSSRWTTLQG